ncbi:hypothetical protein [Fibrobacter sp.]|uniref:hypothetical protein n=1 Tax=Fibrobacter sp. TaxID=35828 RepID=UPI0025C27889|nr:hypothetical protein [Fibrobacter sp.]MBR3073613.1 hypothetical protein [Fibrobacter sp.]
MFNKIRKKIIKFLLNDDEIVIDTFEKMQFDATIQSLKKMNTLIEWYDNYEHSADTKELVHEKIDDEICFLLTTVFRLYNRQSKGKIWSNFFSHL